MAYFDNWFNASGRFKKLPDKGPSLLLGWEASFPGSIYLVGLGGEEWFGEIHLLRYCISKHPWVHVYMCRFNSIGDSDRSYGSCEWCGQKSGVKWEDSESEEDSEVEGYNEVEEDSEVEASDASAVTA